MIQATKNKSTRTLLCAVYKNVDMASSSLLDLMPKVKNETLKSDMTVQLSRYEGFAARAAKLMAEEGIKPQDESVITKLSAKMGSAMNTMMDSTASHLAEMIIEGTTMGMNDMFRQIREGERDRAGEKALQLARDVCSYEERVIEDMKEYLR